MPFDVEAAIRNNTVHNTFHRRSISLTRPQLTLPLGSMIRSLSVSRTALTEAACCAHACRRPRSSCSNSNRAVGQQTRRSGGVTLVPSPADEFDYISTRITKRNPLLAKVNPSGSGSKRPLLGKLGPGKSTSGGRNWMQLRKLYDKPPTSQSEEHELVHQTTIIFNYSHIIMNNSLSILLSDNHLHYFSMLVEPLVCKRLAPCYKRQIICTWNHHLAP